MSYFDEHHYKAILENLRFYSKWGTKWYHNKGYEDSVQQSIDEFESIDTCDMGVGVSVSAVVWVPPIVTTGMSSGSRSASLTALVTSSQT